MTKETRAKFIAILKIKAVIKPLHFFKNINKKFNNKTAINIPNPNIVLFTMA